MTKRNSNVIRQRLEQMKQDAEDYLKEHAGKDDCMGAMRGELDVLVGLHILEEKEMTF